jgi:hypothetical protein
MGQKRSLIAATLLAVNASEFFTQDVEDFINTSAAAATTTATTAVTTQQAGASNVYDEPPVRAAPVRAATATGGKKFSADAGGEAVAVGPGPEESELRAELLAACRTLGKTEEQLVDWLRKKYGVASIDGLNLVQRREVLSFLRQKIAQQRAA